MILSKKEGKIRRLLNHTYISATGNRMPGKENPIVGKIEFGSIKYFPIFNTVA